MSQQINLYNPAFEKQTTLFSADAIARSMLIILLGAGALGAYVVQMTARLEAEEKQAAARLKQREERHTRLLAEFQPRARTPALEAEAIAAETELRSLRAVSTLLARGDMGNTRGYADYFRAFARQNVQGLWLTGATIVGAGKEISVRGRAMQSELVPGFIGRLTQEPSMKGKTFDLLDINEVSRSVKTTGKDGFLTETTEVAPYVEFSLQAVVLPEPAPAAGAPGAAVPPAAAVAALPAGVAK